MSLRVLSTFGVSLISFSTFPYTGLLFPTPCPSLNVPPSVYFTCQIFTERSATKLYQTRIGEVVYSIIVLHNFMHLYLYETLCKPAWFEFEMPPTGSCI